MKSLSLRMKLFSLSGFLIFVSMVVGGVGNEFTQKTNSIYQEILDVNVPNIQHVYEMITQMRQVRVFLLNMALPDTPFAEGKQNIEELNALFKKFDDHKAAYEKIPFEVGEEEVYKPFVEACLRTIKDAKTYAELYVDLKGEKIDQNKTVLEILERIEQDGHVMREASQKLREFHNDIVKSDMGRAKDAAKTGLFWSVATIGIGFVLGSLFALLFSNSLVKTLTRISTSISEASAQVSAAAGQIASSSEELSQSTTEQSASLEETASAIEEMNSMVSKNSENSKSAANVSTQSQQSANNGKDAVEQMIVSMEEISNSNTTIQNQIEHSNNQISEIVKVIEEIGTKTKVINDIVFQTKLLSFNASVEAARAGEHGKGFAVVAEEVGNLAQMSGNAAQEISKLLESSTHKVQGIVNETKTKVGELITQGKSKVEAGSNTAKHCGEILNDIVTNVSNVAAMAGEISAASEEQSRGVQEITKAMGQLNQVTQSNAATSEEAASAAEELSAQAEALTGLVNDLVVTVNGKSDPNFAHKTATKTKTTTAKKPEGKVLTITKDLTKKSPTAAPLKKASGDDSGGSSAPSYDDDRFKEV